jgi:hypothetical protein
MWCFLRGTDRICKYYLQELRLQRIEVAIRRILWQTVVDGVVEFLVPRKTRNLLIGQVLVFQRGLINSLCYYRYRGGCWPRSYEVSDIWVPYLQGINNMEKVYNSFFFFVKLITRNLGIEVFTTTKISIVVFWIMTQCYLLGGYQFFSWRYSVRVLYPEYGGDGFLQNSFNHLQNCLVSYLRRLQSKVQTTYDARRCVIRDYIGDLC